MDIPDQKNTLREALIMQRRTTLAVYRDLPASYWLPTQFPFSAITNPPLWELGHIAWFAEFFAVRWAAEDGHGLRIRPLLDGADELFNSSLVPHTARWTNIYPSPPECVAYMEASLSRVLDALATDDGTRLPLFQLVLAHEDMHLEALLMTLRVLDLPLPAPFLPVIKNQNSIASADPLRFAGGAFLLGHSARSFRFDNEFPARATTIAPFEIDALPVSAAALAAWRGRDAPQEASNTAAMHVSHDEASAFARDHGRRLPTEAEWEFAATCGGEASARFMQSSGQVWEWTDSEFAPFPGFVAGPYADYSAPWFADRGVRHMVLKGGSFATHPRIKYPQYRNFYTPDRRDMFCGFRTCAV